MLTNQILGQNSGCDIFCANFEIQFIVSFYDDPLGKNSPGGKYYFAWWPH